jgi:hypothetical protein
MYEGSLSSGHQVGPANTIQYALAGAGHVALLLGDTDRAAQLFADSHVVARQLGSDGNARAAVGEGLLARQLGDLTAARAHHLAELAGDLDSAEFAPRRALHSHPGHAAALEGLACVAAATDDAAAAARLLGAADWWRSKRHRPASRLERHDRDRAEQRGRTTLEDAGFDAAHRAGAEQRHAVVGDPPTRTQR